MTYISEIKGRSGKDHIDNVLGRMGSLLDPQPVDEGSLCVISIVRSNSEVGINVLEEIIEPAELYTDQQLNDIRDVAGFELPANYCNFLKTYGNAFVGGLADSSSDLPILSFFPAETVISTLNSNSLFKEHRMIPIADCELENA